MLPWTIRVGDTDITQLESPIRGIVRCGCCSYSLLTWMLSGSLLAVRGYGIAGGINFSCCQVG